MQIPKTLEQVRAFKGKYPKPLRHLFFNKIVGRRSCYGMRGMLRV